MEKSVKMESQHAPNTLPMEFDMFALCFASLHFVLKHDMSGNTAAFSNSDKGGRYVFNR